MTITSSDLAPDVEIRLVGKIGTSECRELKQALEEAVVLRPEYLILDLTRCTSLDDAVLGRLLLVDKQLRTLGASLVLRGPGPLVGDQLAAAGLSKRVQRSVALDLPAARLG